VRLTLGDLLDHRPFGLELCTGGEAARATLVLGCHSIDLPDPVRWLQPDWVMLTTGVQLCEDETAQRRLVGELADGGMAALGLGLGIAHETTPPALVEEAERCGLPLLTVPLETPFREIVSFVAGATVSADLGALRRLASMQRVLLDALHEPDPERAIVERVGTLLGGAEAAYLDAGGRPLATTAPGADWSAGDDDRHFAAPVLRGAVPVGSLAVLLGGAGAVSRHVARPIVRTAAELLALVAVAREAGGRERGARRRRLGLRVVRAAQGAPDPGLAAELAGEGLDFTRPCHVAVVAAPVDGAGTEAAGGGRAVPGAAAADGGGAVAPDLDGLAAALAEAGEVVIAADGARVVVLAQGDAGALAAALRARGAPAGLSEALAGPETIAAGAAQARLALAVALGAPPDGDAVVAHAALDPAVALLGAASPEARARLRAALAPVAAQPRLRAAVGAYLAAGLDLGRAAHALGLHRNSLRYRLDRAELALGRSLRDTSTVATLHLALLAERLEPASDPIAAGDHAPRRRAPDPIGEPDPIRLDRPGPDA